MTSEPEKKDADTSAPSPPDNASQNLDAKDAPASGTDAASATSNLDVATSKTATSETATSESGTSETGTTTATRPKRKILIGSQLGDDESNVKSATKQLADQVGSVKVETDQVDPERAVRDQEDSGPAPTKQAVVGATVEPTKIDSAIKSSVASPSPRQSDSSPAEQRSSSSAQQPLPGESAVDQKYTIPSSANIDDEVDRMLGGVSMDELISGQSVDEELELESRVKGTVDKIHNENIFFNLKGRFVGIASARNFKDVPEPGAMLDVIIKSFNSEDGIYEVSVPGASVEVADWSDLTPGAIVEVKVTGSNTGGLECSVNNIRGFIPASQIEIFRVENFGEYVNRKLQCVVTECNPKKKKLVLSHRAIAEREREAQKKQLLETLQPGETRDGTVTKLMDFGAFVDIGGAEGLIHISKLAWDRVEHPSDVLKEGEKISVKIEKINHQTGKIGLSFRDTQEHPWKSVDQKYPENSTVRGTVSKLAQFGAFVKLEPGIEGLVHISEIAHHRVIAVKTHLNVGDEVDVKVLSVDPDAQKIGLSIKALIDKPAEPQSKHQKEDDDEPLRESAVPKSSAPLKGGTQRKTGGEDFGLNW